MLTFLFSFRIGLFAHKYSSCIGFRDGTVVKNQSTKAGDVRDASLIPGFGRSPGRGNGNPLRYSCLGNPVDRGVWRAAIHGVAKSDTPERLSTHTYIHIHTIGSKTETHLIH